MQIDETTHEHSGNGKVYTYQAEYSVGSSSITWSARARNADGPWEQYSGSIAVTSPGVATVAEQAVRDAVVAQIDASHETL